MKVISLNIWNGRAGDVSTEFFKKYSDVDVFLLQEVTHKADTRTLWHSNEKANLFDEISNLLPDHQGFFAPAQDDQWGLATFVKKNLNIKETGDIFVHNQKDSMKENDAASLGKNLQYLIISEKNEDLNILNFHGLWNGQGKGDSEDRINQSKRIVDFVKGLKGEIVLMGDFNLRPDTESLQIVEMELNLENLISKYNISSTRTSFYEKEEKFADYTFVSQNIKVKDFKILPDEVSDHAAMFLEIE